MYIKLILNYILLNLLRSNILPAICYATNYWSMLCRICIKLYTYMYIHIHTYVVEQFLNKLDRVLRCNGNTVIIYAHCNTFHITQ